MRYHRGLIAIAVALVALLLLGCVPSSILAEFGGGRAEKESASTEPAAAGPATPKPGAEEGETDVAGRWMGSLTFTDFEMHTTDEQTVLVFSNEIAETMDKSYGILIDTEPDANTATLNFDGTLIIAGAMSRTGDEVTFEFRQAGTGELEVGATLPVTFTLTGRITDGAEPEMSGNVQYDVYTMDGAPAWTQMGTWSVTR